MAEGLRERKKAATRQVVHEAAMRLVLEHGIDHVTIDQIAEEAGIARRTFTNYFCGKEDALLHADGLQVGALVNAIRDRPAAESAWTAMRSVIDGMAAWDEQMIRRLAVRSRLAVCHPSLLAAQAGKHASRECELAAVVTERDDVGPIRAQVLSTAFLASLRIAMRIWVQEEQTRHPLDVINEVLDEMQTSFTGPARASTPGTGC